MSTSTTTVTETDACGRVTTTTTTVTLPSEASSDQGTPDGIRKEWVLPRPAADLVPLTNFSGIKHVVTYTPFELTECTGDKVGSIRGVKSPEGLVITEKCIAVYPNGHAYTITSDTAGLAIVDGTYKSTFIVTPVDDVTCKLAYMSVYETTDPQQTRDILGGMLEVFGSAIREFVTTLAKPTVLLSKFHARPSYAPNNLAMSVDDVTPQWLSGVYDTEVESFDKKLCEAGQLAYTVILTNIKIKNNSVSRPSSCAIKLHVGLDDVRAVSVGTQSYEKEVWYYVHGIRMTSVRSPEPYFVITDGRENVEYFNLIMEDLTVNWKLQAELGVKDSTYENFIHLLKTQIIPQQVRFWEKYDIIAGPTMSRTGKTFSGLYGTPEMVEMFPQTLPVARQAMNELGFKNGMPENVTKILDMYADLAENGCEKMKIAREETCRIVNSRPQTWLHGDLNGTNIWESKTNPKDVLVCDFQIVRMGSGAFDFFTHLAFMETAAVANGRCTQLLKDYHTELSKQDPKAAESYPIEHIMDDVLVSIVTFMPMITAVMTGQYMDPNMPAEKKAFAFGQFWNKGFENLGNIFADLSGYDLIPKLVGKTYDNLGPRRT